MTDTAKNQIDRNNFVSIRMTIEHVLSHPECQIEDPEFDQWCDSVIEALEGAKIVVSRLMEK